MHYNENHVQFSIIIPAYQVEKYLKNCINSVLGQANETCEIILIDDGSTDETPEICNIYENKYQIIKVIHQKNAGLSAARNRGIREAKGQYCIFLDSDDKLAEDALEGLEKSLKEYNFPEIVLNRYKKIEYNPPYNSEVTSLFEKEKLRVLSIPEIYKEIQKNSQMWLSAWLFCVNRNYILEKSLFFCEGILHEDEEWVPRIFLNANTVGFNNNIFYYYYINRPGSITSETKIQREIDKLKIIDLLDEEFQNDKYTEEMKAVVKERCRRIFFGVICQLITYRKNENYVHLIKNVKHKQNILKYATKCSHRISYFLIKTLGLEKTAYFLNKNLNKKR